MGAGAISSNHYFLSINESQSHFFNHLKSAYIKEKSSHYHQSDTNQKKELARNQMNSQVGNFCINAGPCKIDYPDEIDIITVNRHTLPKGHYTKDGFETCQVFDIDISRVVTERND